MLNDQDFAKTWRDANRQRVADLRSRWLMLLLSLMMIGVVIGFGLAIVLPMTIELAGQYP